eukprot:CCRYP_016654-RA/>CCRYP_016654-RA protein AED:0.44 eAED:0.44 QI:0/0/0/1/0/0/2/0/73
MTSLSGPMTPTAPFTQIKLFPHLSSQANLYQMILYHVDSNSTWDEPTKNKTEGELILARNRALRMKACGIQPT